MKSNSIVLTCFNRLHTLEQQLNIAVNSPVIDNIIICHNNPKKQLPQTPLLANRKVTLLKSKLPRCASYRWRVALELGLNYAILLDDDTFLSHAQIQSLFEKILTEPSRPHGLIGSCFTEKHFINQATGRATNTWHINENRAVDVLHQVYCVNKLHIEGFFHLTKNQPESWAKDYLCMSDDIFISIAGKHKPLIHDLGTIQEDEQGWSPLIALHKQPNFDKIRADVLTFFSETEQFPLPT